jgi:hypothetical protein
MQLTSTKRLSKSIQNNRKLYVNREFNSLTKEVEFQELEIQLANAKEMKASEHKKVISIKRKIRSEIKSLET